MAAMWRNDAQNASLNCLVKFFVAISEQCLQPNMYENENDLKKQGHSNTKEKHK